MNKKKNNTENIELKSNIIIVFCIVFLAFVYFDMLFFGLLEKYWY